MTGLTVKAEIAARTTLPLGDPASRQYQPSGSFLQSQDERRVSARHSGAVATWPEAGRRIRSQEGTVIASQATFPRLSRVARGVHFLHFSMRQEIVGLTVEIVTRLLPLPVPLHVIASIAVRVAISFAKRIRRRERP